MAIRHVAIAFLVCLVFNLILHGKLHEFQEEKFVVFFLRSKVESTFNLGSK